MSANAQAATAEPVKDLPPDLAEAALAYARALLNFMGESRPGYKHAAFTAERDARDALLSLAAKHGKKPPTDGAK